ncbi:MAG: uridine kinase [Acutalibacteraceae bacterium]
MSLKQIYDAINKLQDIKDTVLIAIDGKCASGKTTMADEISRKIDCTVFHMDDYFLRAEQRTEQRLKEPGGNVDRERFFSEVLLPLKSGAKNITYRPFDCSTLCLKEPVTTEIKPIVIVEGSYSCQPDLYDFYDLHIFTDVDSKTQLDRIIKRNGTEAAKRFTEKWIPLENTYFQVYDIKEKCQIYLKT